MVHLNSMIYYRSEIAMLKWTNEANLNGHIFGSHVKKFLWQGTITSTHNYLQGCTSSISSWAPSPSLPHCTVNNTAPTPRPDSGATKGSQGHSHLPTAILDSFITVTDVLTGRKLTGHRRWTQLTQGCGCACMGRSGVALNMWPLWFGTPAISSFGPEMKYTYISVNYQAAFCFVLFFLFWLRWVFVAVRRLSLVVVSRSYSLLRCAGFSLWWLLLLRSTGSRHTDFSSCGMRAQQLWLAGSRAQAQ